MMSREEGRLLMTHVMSLIQNKDKEAIEALLRDLSPEKDCFKKFTCLVRPTFSFRESLNEWRPAVKRFYEYYKEQNTEDIQSYFINLND